MPTAETGLLTRLRPSEFARISKLAYDTFGLDLKPGKETLVSTRLGKHLRESGCRTFDEYCEHILADSTGASLITLIDALTTNHTSFFREPAHFDFFRDHVLPENRSRGGLAVWSAACSTGEEPYTIAMAAGEAGALPASSVSVLATDISTRVLERAQRAVYTAEQVRSIPGEALRRYWLRGERQWDGWFRARPEIRRMIRFQRLNLLDPAARPGLFGLIFCRNVMIYFDKPTQQKVINLLTSCLEPGGYLFTGHSESLNGISHELESVQAAIYRKPARPGHRGGSR